MHNTGFFGILYWWSSLPIFSSMTSLVANGLGRFRLFGIIWLSETLLVLLTDPASGEESKSFVIVVIIKSSETFIDRTSPTIWYVVLNDPIKDAPKLIVYEFVATYIICRVWFPNWFASSFSDNVLVWLSTGVIYCSIVRVTASNIRNKWNLK